jgi:DNA polymerase-3 subunit delta
LGPLKYKIKRLISIYEFDKEEKSISSLLTKYKPPIFWKEKSSVQTQMSMWNVDQLNTLLDKINHIEILCKENYEVSETIFNKFLLDIITKKVLINTYSSH